MDRLSPLGKVWRMGSRPLDIAKVGKDQLIVKTSSGISLIEAKTGLILDSAKASTSLTGVIVDKLGGSIYFTDAASGVHEYAIKDRKLISQRTFELPKPKAGGAAYGCGLDMLGRLLVVAASRSNTLVTMTTDRIIRSIPVDVAPYDVVILGNGQALVSCWSRVPKSGEQTSAASGTPVPVNAGGRAVGGTLCLVDLANGKVVHRFNVGLQPTEILVRGDRAFVANANSDTVSVVDWRRRIRIADWVVKPSTDLPFGSMPNGLSVVGDNLAVACGGNNAVALLDLKSGAAKGWIPTEWFPGPLASDGQDLIIGNIQGAGSRTKQSAGYGVYGFAGSIQRVTVPEDLQGPTAGVKSRTRVDAILAARQGGSTGRGLPIPEKLGQSSPIKHIVYILKENRTYDQLFGDIGRGDGDPSLCIYGRNVTPNHHALADQFVLLDNFYCNGVLSADGHAWSMEGIATTYYERAFGGWTRSYPFGDDPLAIAQSGYLWDWVLGAGKSFRNYGEFDYSTPPAGMKWKQVFEKWRDGQTPKFGVKIGVDRLRRYSNHGSPGWNMDIPDQIRADEFIRELGEFEAKGSYPNLNILYLPQDHTSGTSEGAPTPRAHLADNDLALGRAVDALSRSKFWKNMAIFVVEDDPQDGFDHVDGHRSICLVVSPYVKRGAHINKFYNQTSVLHSMLRILGIAPPNQSIAKAPLMNACFTTTPDTRPFTFLPNNIPLDEMNPAKSALRGEALKWARVSETIPDEWTGKRTEDHDDQLNRILWFAAKGSKPYPAHLAGAHGKGLKSRGLILTKDDD
jgi:DNA-binding beta-propeller fold protein YncE